ARGLTVRLQVRRGGEPVEGLTVYGAAFAGRATDAAGEIAADDVVPGRYTLRLARGGETVARSTAQWTEKNLIHVIELE
ncbi:MAG: hypothetical protein ACPHRO_11995, partial [Nannocystaceae bacterium]